MINVFSKLFRVCPKESSLEVTIPKPVAPETSQKEMCMLYKRFVNSHSKAESSGILRPSRSVNCLCELFLNCQDAELGKTPEGRCSGIA